MVIVSEMLDPLVSLWNGFVGSLPGIAAFVIVAFVGYFVALFLGHVVREILLRLGLDRWLVKSKLSKGIGHASVSTILGTLTKWWVFIAFLVPAVNFLQLGTLSELLARLVLWLPNLIIAVIILIFSLIFADYVADFVRHEKIKGARLFGDIVKVVILVFLAIIALGQIGVRVALAEQTFLIVIGGIALALAIAVGLGFGYALKDEAKTWIRTIKRRI